MPPIKPSQIDKTQVIPEIIFDCFNELINKNFNNGVARVAQKEVLTWLKASGCCVDEAFREKWLDVEDAYRKAGWKVEYDKPGYNESGDAYYIFRSKKN